MIDTNKKLIGRLEYIDFPELGLFNLEAKIDTGAYSGSIHISFVEEVPSPEGTKLHFKLLDETHPEYQGKEYVVSEFKQKKVISSNGDSEMRYFVKLPVTVGGETYRSTFSLSNRKDLRRPVLLGRKNIKRRFIVDPSQAFLLTTTNH
jgi:hypothetical protein